MQVQLGSQLVVVVLAQVVQSDQSLSLQQYTPASMYGTSLVPTDTICGLATVFGVVTMQERNGTGVGVSGPTGAGVDNGSSILSE